MSYRDDWLERENIGGEEGKTNPALCNDVWYFKLE